MSIKEEVSDFLEQYQKVWFYESLANSYSFNPLLDHHYDEDGQVFWHKVQTAEAWDWWQSAKKHAIPHNHIVVPATLDINIALQQAELIFQKAEHHIQREWAGISGREYELRKLRWIESKAIELQVSYKVMMGYVNA